MDFLEATSYLNSLQLHKIKLGLDAMESFLEKVERPDKQLRFVHVAGTNGKGSVSVNIVSVLKSAGYHVGLFTSPHLSSVRERFRINDRYISEEDFSILATKVRDVLGEDMITYFEFTTAIALLWFARSNVDIVVLETGLGGRLDATNVVTPLVSIITNISMDHEAYLGNNLQSIAFEKAGIIKPGIPVVTGEKKDVCLAEIQKKCRECQSQLFVYGDDFYADNGVNERWRWKGGGQLEGVTYSNLLCGMRGDYQMSNSSLAICCLELLRNQGFIVTPNNVRDGLSSVAWPGRLEYIQINKMTREQITKRAVSTDSAVRYLLDGAHNPSGVESLVRTLNHEYEYNRLIIIWGAMEDKDLSLTLPPVAKLASVMILTKPQGERAANPSLLLNFLEEDQRESCHIEEDVGKSLALAEQLADNKDLVVVAGSLYLIGDVRSRLVGELVQ